MNVSLYDHCVEYGKEDLLRQWHPVKNGGLTPRELAYGSKRRVWWRCEKGHEWQAMVYTRTGGGSGCPVCTGRRVQTGVNDLATVFPDLARQWHPSKNGPLTPSDVQPGSHRKVWWRCGKGHEWQAIIKSRSSGCGCPVCTHRRIVPGDNDLATTRPDLAAQWHPARNGMLKPEDLAAGARKKVWWMCEKGHEWQAAVASRAGGAGCPVCAGRKIVPGENDLASRYPAVAAQWHPSKNGTLTPESVSPYSNRRVWWICEKGHEYQAAAAARTGSDCGCPYCAGRKVLAGFNDLAAVEPQVAAQWHPALNGALTAEMVTAGSHKKVWWQCPEGHVWKAVVYARTGPKKNGCPVCAGRVRSGRAERYAAAWAEQQSKSGESRI